MDRLRSDVAAVGEDANAITEAATVAREESVIVTEDTDPMRLRPDRLLAEVGIASSLVGKKEHFGAPSEYFIKILPSHVSATSAPR
ncbi:hypothetical protein ACLOJK_027513 [Asimina triloba]